MKLGKDVFFPGRKHTIGGAADKWTNTQKREEKTHKQRSDTDRRQDTMKRDTEDRNRREIK
jgi:hypothetical protein